MTVKQLADGSLFRIKDKRYLKVTPRIGQRNIGSNWIAVVDCTNFTVTWLESISIVDFVILEPRMPESKLVPTVGIN